MSQNNTAPEIMDLACLLVSYGNLETQVANHCASMLFYKQGKAGVASQASHISASKQEGALSFIKRAVLSGWIDKQHRIVPSSASSFDNKGDEYQVALDSRTAHSELMRQDVPYDPSIPNTPVPHVATTMGAAPSKAYWDKVRMFSAKAALEITQHSKNTSNEKKERISFNFAPKKKEGDAYDWENNIFFTVTAEEALAMLLFLTGGHLNLLSPSDRSEGIYHKTEELNKKLYGKKQPDGNMLLDMQAWKSAEDRKDIKIPITPQDGMRLMGFLSSKVCSMHPYVGLSFSDTLRIAANAFGEKVTTES